MLFALLSIAMLQIYVRLFLLVTGITKNFFNNRLFSAVLVKSNDWLGELVAQGIIIKLLAT
ncbi:hypothetical protein NIES2130_33670 [Scytonema sp. HK-05]|nr:hypothetical protein NIES2130_33670 [Scytonema sp. HK-05]